MLQVGIRAACFNNSRCLNLSKKGESPILFMDVVVGTRRGVALGKKIVRCPNDAWFILTSPAVLFLITAELYARQNFLHSAISCGLDKRSNWRKVGQEVSVLSACGGLCQMDFCSMSIL